MTNGKWQMANGKWKTENDKPSVSLLTDYLLFSICHLSFVIYEPFTRQASYHNRRQNEKPWRRSNLKLLHSRHRPDLQRKDTSRNLLAYRHPGDLDWNRWLVRMGVSHHISLDCVSVRAPASGCLAGGQRRTSRDYLVFE